MQVNKPTPEELDTFLKGLSDEDLNELIVTRAHHNNTVPIEFMSKSTGASCGIDNDGMQLAMYEQNSRAKAAFAGLGITKDTDTTLKDLFAAYPDNGPSPFALARHHRLVVAGLGKPIPFPLDSPELHSHTEHDLQLGIDHARRLQGRMSSSTERFEAFIDKLTIEELFEIGDLLIKSRTARPNSSYYSQTLDQEERIYHTDLPLVYDTIKSRYTTRIPVGKDHRGRTIYSVTYPHGIEYGVYIGGIFRMYRDLSFKSYLG